MYIYFFFTCQGNLDAKTEEYLEHIFSVYETANKLPSKSQPTF